MEMLSRMKMAMVPTIAVQFCLAQGTATHPA